MAVLWQLLTPARLHYHKLLMLSCCIILHISCQAYYNFDSCKSLLHGVRIIVIPWTQVVCLIYTPKGHRPKGWGCIYQANHECTWYNSVICKISVHEPCVGEQKAAQILFTNHMAVFIFPPISFSFGLKCNIMLCCSMCSWFWIFNCGLFKFILLCV